MPLPIWRTHTADLTQHIPPGGQTGFVLVKIGPGDGQTGWSAVIGGGSGDMLSGIYDPRAFQSDIFDINPKTGNFDAGSF